MLAPLRTALTEAIVRHAKATGVREALEAEVCVLFDRAVQAEGNPDVVVEDVAASAMQAVGSALKDEVEAAAVVEATKKALAQTLKSLQALSPEPANKAGDAATVEAQLAAAVDAATTASMDGGGDAAAAAALASVDGIAVRPLADTIARVDQLVGADAAGAADGAAAAAKAAAEGKAARAAAAPSPAAVAAQAKAEASTKFRNSWATVGAVAAAALAAYAIAQTAPGQAAIAAVQGLVQPLLDKMGPIHIGDAERGLLETVYLLLTSIVCVPLVCKLIPGGSPVLGYLVRKGPRMGSHAGSVGRMLHLSVSSKHPPPRLLLNPAAPRTPAPHHSTPPPPPPQIGGALIGPYALNLISDVHHVQHLAELGVVFLLFVIGLELSLERLQSMAKYVFGMGAAQVSGVGSSPRLTARARFGGKPAHAHRHACSPHARMRRLTQPRDPLPCDRPQTIFTLLGVASVAMAAAGLPGTSAIILGGALAMSTTAVAIQVLEDRGEMGSRHGRATFSVLLFQVGLSVGLVRPVWSVGSGVESGGASHLSWPLLVPILTPSHAHTPFHNPLPKQTQDLAVVVLLMLIPLLAPDASGASGGGAQIAQALGIAAVKAVVCIVSIIAGGRIFIRPL
jgi:hypothetical protein